MAETEDYSKAATPTAHKTSHQDGGSDEISVQGLAGVLPEAQPSTWPLVSGKPTTFAPEAHKTSHQDGGSDEISVEGLLGELTAEQKSAWTKVAGKPSTFPPEAHKTSHQDGGSDEISVQGLAGVLPEAQPSTWALVSGKPSTFTPEAHKTSHQDGGADEISVTGLSGLLADAQTPLAHKTSHQDGGADEISVTGLAGLLADAQTPLISFFQKARAYRGTAQTITHDIEVRVGINTDDFDPSNITDLTNNRIIPTKPGYYQANGQVGYSLVAEQLAFIVYIKKNGNYMSMGNRSRTTYPNPWATVGDLIYLNGTTDYIELWTLIEATVDQVLDVASYNNYLSIVGPF